MDILQGIAIWDVVEEYYWLDGDGDVLLFPDLTAAKNMLYTEGYAYEYMSTGVEFRPYAIVD